MIAGQWRSRALLLGACLLFAPPAYAEDSGRVLQVLSASELLIDIKSSQACEARHSLFSLHAQEEPKAEAIAFAEAKEFRTGQGCVCTVAAHSKSPLIRPGDLAKEVNLRSGSAEIPGRYDLLREGHREYAARYKPLVYGGLLFGQTASTLEKGELLVGLTSLMYGPHERLQFSLTWPRLIENAGEAGAKLRFYENEDMKLAAHIEGTRFFSTGQGSWLAEILFDSVSNARSLSHTRLRFSSKIPKQIVFEDETKKKQYSIELSSVNEWMLKSWHRILFGPKFVAGDSYDLGFLFSMVFVFQRFHAALNLNVNSVRQFDFAGYRQAVGADFYWRF